MVRSLLSARFSSRPSSAVKPPETVTLVPKASPSSLLHCWIGGASSSAAVRDKSSSKTPPVQIRCRSNFSFLISPFEVFSRSSGILNLECAVLPPGSIVAAIPEVVVSKTIWFLFLNVASNARYKYVFPVPPRPSTKNMTLSFRSIANIIVLYANV
ncbi:hypothetical protein ACLB2K_064324 [Fragaria x ananassa]